MIDVTLKLLSILGIAEKLGDTMSGLALTAVPSLLKYHSRASEASEKGGYLLVFIIGVPIAGTAGRGNAETPFPSRAIESTFSFSSLNLSSAKRAGSLRG
jgi:hypothetical protein